LVRVIAAMTAGVDIMHARGCALTAFTAQLDIVLILHHQSDKGIFG
jgi:hypothetical protein